MRVGTEWEVRDVMNIAMMIVDQNGKSLSDHHQKTGFAPADQCDLSRALC